jgi:hypothetical protein
MEPLPLVFELFLTTPPEIQLQILSYCSRIDLVCLSLTSHALRNFTLPMIPSKPSLQLVDQLTSPARCRFSDSPLPPQVMHTCGHHREVAYEPRLHRWRRHKYVSPPDRCTYESYPKEHPVCQIPRCKKHCACISCPLFTRLRGWMGNDRRYCARCQKFTRRAKKYSGRCKF